MEQAREVISTNFPEVDARRLEHLGSGWDFDAYLTGDDWVVRFPRRAECANSFEAELRVHRLVASVLPSRIAVPHAELIGEPAAGFPYRIAAHRLIPGVAADAVDRELRPALARDVGESLGAIHAVSETAAASAGVRAMSVSDADEIAWFERGSRLAPELRGRDPVLEHALGWLSRVSPSFTRFDAPLRLIHNDLGPDHLIADSGSGELKGIIDWSDAALGDPMRDFVVLVAFGGWEFADEVLRSYPHALDSGFHERLRFATRLLSIMWLAEAHEREADVAKHIEWVRNAFGR
jgi:aminoglycoside phosphotransferase (APT) family kinase protein